MKNLLHSSLLYNKHQDYKVFMIPALMGILMMMLCGFLPALNIVGEKERAAHLCLLLSWLVYGIICQGSLLLVWLLDLLLSSTIVGVWAVKSYKKNS